MAGATLAPGVETPEKDKAVTTSTTSVSAAQVRASEPIVLLDRKANDRPLNYFGWMLRANKRFSKNLRSMVREIYQVTRKRQRLTPKEYFFYHLFDDSRYSPAAKATFIGNKIVEDLAKGLGSPWPKLATDKPTLTALLRGYHVPTPETQAVRHNIRYFPGSATLRSSSDVARFLRESAKFPLFGKPVASARSLGVADLERYDHSDDCLVLRSGKRVSVEKFVGQVEQYATGGYMFQTRLAPHPEIEKVIGGRIGTVRVVVLSDERGPTLLRAAWKIPVGNNVADNFWRPGNLLGGVDVETGKLLRVVRQDPHGFEEVFEHPDSRIVFKDFTFPEWPKMRQAVLDAANATPTCFLQGWDVALCNTGPVVVELEGDGGDPVMSQACFDTGLLDTPFGAFVEQAQLKLKQTAGKTRAQRRELLLGQANQVRQCVQSLSTVRSGPLPKR